jgi:hypothetical protein
MIAIGMDVPGASSIEPRRATQHFATWQTDESDTFGYDMGRLAGKLPVTVSAVRQRLLVMPGGKKGEMHPLGLAPIDQGETGIGQAVRILLTLTNGGAKDLAGRICLSTRDLHMRNSGILPYPLPRQGPRPPWRAIVDYEGNRRQPIAVHFAGMVVGEDHPFEDRIVLPHVGYNAGLVGMQHPITISGGQSVTVPIVLFSVNAPDPKNPKAIDATRVAGEILTCIAHVRRLGLRPDHEITER